MIAIGGDQTGTIYTGPVTTADLAHHVSGLENPYRGLDPFTYDTFARFVQAATPARQVNLLVIDQFEELFITSEVTQREALIAILAALPSFADISTHVVLTMRPEYLDRLFPVRALYDVATTQAINMREMSEDELRLSIQRPLQAMAHRPGFGNSRRHKPDARRKHIARPKRNQWRVECSYLAVVHTPWLCL